MTTVDCQTHKIKITEVKNLSDVDLAVIEFTSNIAYKVVEEDSQTIWAMAVKLYELKSLSSGMAANLLGCDRVALLLKLNDYGVAMIDLTHEDLLSDLANYTLQKNSKS